MSLCSYIHNAAEVGASESLKPKPDNSSTAFREITSLSHEAGPDDYNRPEVYIPPVKLYAVRLEGKSTLSPWFSTIRDSMTITSPDYTWGIATASLGMHENHTLGDKFAAIQEAGFQNCEIGLGEYTAWVRGQVPNL